jgi:hypothetical protein
MPTATGRLLRARATAPALPCRQPADQPGAAHHGHCRLRHPTDGRAYLDRRKADGKTSMEAMRALKRRLSDIVYRRMLDDAISAARTSPGGATGNDY